MTKSVGYTDVSITKVELSETVSAGIQWGLIGDGMVPIFEEQVARLERNYSIPAWIEMDEMEKAMIIAIRRIDIAMKNLQTEAEIKAANRKAGAKA